MTYEEKYIIARWAYSVSEETMTNAEYTQLHQYILANNLLPEYTGRSWSSDPCPLDLLKKYNLLRLAEPVILSSKTQSIPSLGLESEVKEQYGNMNETHTVSFKHDGNNIQLTYFNGGFTIANSRGRATEPLDLSQVKSMVPGQIDMDGKVRIICEISISKQNFLELCKMFPEKELAGERSAVRTALTHPEALHLLTIHAFDIEVESGEWRSTYIFYMLEKWGFKVPMYRVVKNYEQLMEAAKELSSLEETYPYPTDGLVVRQDSARVLYALRIYAWEEPIYRSYVIGFEEEPKDQYYNLRAVIRSVRVKDGSRQTRIDIDNPARMMENNLEIGSPIAFTIRSSAIADFNSNVTQMLQRTYKNDYSFYRGIVDYQEEVKEENRRKRLQAET